MVIRCHSSFAHYNMFHNSHRHCGGDNYGSIFNIKYNCSGGHTNFWGGLGFGLGAGLGNWCGGWLNNIMGGMGNWFSPFGAMMPGIMQAFGYGGYNMPWASNYSNYDRFSKYDSGNGKLYNGNPCNCKPEVNADEAAIDDLRARFDLLNENSSEDDINRLRSALVTKKNTLDGVDDNSDKGRIETMLDNLPKRKASEVVQPADADEEAVEVEEEDPFDPAKGTADGGPGCQDVSIKVGARDGITVYSLPTNITKDTLDALANNGTIVAPAYNPQAREDQYIYGKISNVEEKDGVLSYVIDCSEYGVFKQKYTVTQTGNGSNTWKINLHKNSQFAALCLGRGWAEREYTYDAETQILKRDDNRTVLTVNTFISCLESYVNEHSDDLSEDQKAKLRAARDKFIEDFKLKEEDKNRLEAIELDTDASDSE